MNYDKEDFKIDLETNKRIVAGDITNGFRQGYLQALKNYENLILFGVGTHVCVKCKTDKIYIDETLLCKKCLLKIYDQAN